jgi:hypothetical protein
MNDLMDDVIINPLPFQVRNEIKNIRNPDERIFCKSLYLLGASVSELAAKQCKGEKAYGSLGNDAAISEYQPQGISQKQVELILQKKLTIEQAFSPVKIAVFKISKARKRVKPNERIPFRNVALPLDGRFEPWTQEVYDYYQRAGEGLVFPYNRKHYLDHLRIHDVFINLKYSVDTYQTKPEHLRRFTLEGLRKTRKIELTNFYNFTEFESGIFFGTYHYRNLSEHYEFYLPKLLK